MPKTLPHPGAVVMDGTTVHFALYVPGKRHVSVVGGFNRWDPHADPMEQVDEGLWFKERKLDEGEHEYRFHADGVWFCDPYARDIAYGDHKQLHAVVRTGAAAGFEWRHDGFDRPGFADLIIYELHVGDFTPEGTFNAVTQRLDYLRGLGVNAIELMPIVESELEGGWGYQPVCHFACSLSYGSGDDLRRLIDEAHGRGMAVLLDLVLCHAGHSHPLNQLYDYDKSPWFGDAIGEMNRFGLPTFDHRKPPTQAFARDVQRCWLEAFHVDGFRYDYATSIGIDGENGLPRLAHEARQVRHDAFLIAEYLPEDPAIMAQCELDAAWRLSASHALKCLASHADHGGFRCDDMAGAIRALDWREQGYQAASNVINYLESHDEDRLIDDLTEAGWDAHAARRRAGLIATLLLTAPGVPMIHQGQELAAATDPRPNEANPMLWQMLESDAGRGMHDHCAKLIHLRREHAALRSNHFKVEAIDEDQRWVVFHRWTDGGDRVTVALNFANDARRLTFVLPQPRRWRDAISGRTLDSGDEGRTELELQPHEAALLLPHHA